MKQLFSKSILSLPLTLVFFSCLNGLRVEREMVKLKLRHKPKITFPISLPPPSI